MDTQQTNLSNGQDEPNGMLPQVQQTDDSAVATGQGRPLSNPPISNFPQGVSAQTIPDSRSLVAIPDQAGDNDLIEKEWVLKAKQIVEHTSEDPFVQQQELSKMKADYMKKRYNKDLGIV